MLLANSIVFGASWHEIFFSPSLFGEERFLPLNWENEPETKDYYIFVPAR